MSFTPAIDPYFARRIFRDVIAEANLNLDDVDDKLKSEKQFLEYYDKQFAVLFNNYIRLRGIVRGDTAAIAQQLTTTHNNPQDSTS